MPKLWNVTIEAHRNAVRDATLTATAALVAEHGPAAVTMSQIAKETGIGRATLYKYFPDVETILTAWHERQVQSHLDQLAAIRDRADSPAERLEAVLAAYAVLSHQHPGSDLATSLHRADHVSQARQHLHTFIRDLLSDAAAAGDVRTDVPPGELAIYCLHALTAAGALPTKAAIHRLVAVTLTALHP
ncbi:TetR/AcrR family transcriptional regulator [Kribbella qitaiheensis]|uniref:TetR/AcrR family transcriptional regulator n=1 Tax=Kribbella qitaiheensis TaxID=1544730 RepID=A0A7G6X0M4_9ACTN|nr:TetR/AcrR family transcriptional regulator [Kribbella qitaiheensis]QNE19789.1 TetR/AcrR family transcriptional regulator [Kribbella qitaiheensis]